MSQFKIISTEVIKEGDGKRGHWVLRKAKLEGSELEPTGFEAVSAGDMVEVTETQNGEYINHNYKKVKTEAAPSTAPSTSPVSNGSDGRVLKMLIIIAEQIGVDKDQILAVVEGK